MHCLRQGCPPKGNRRGHSVHIPGWLVKVYMDVGVGETAVGLGGKTSFADLGLLMLSDSIWGLWFLFNKSFIFYQCFPLSPVFCGHHSIFVGFSLVLLYFLILQDYPGSYIYSLSPIISNILKELWLLLLENGIKVLPVGTECAQRTMQGNICMYSNQCKHT